ncbi:MAG TPA: hypothetical protein VIK96_01820 [Bacilli bacterium]
MKKIYNLFLIFFGLAIAVISRIVYEKISENFIMHEMYFINGHLDEFLIILSLFGTELFIIGLVAFPKSLRYDYYLRALICFLISLVFILVLPIFTPNIFEIFDEPSGTGYGYGILFLIACLINCILAQQNSNSERQFQTRIEEIERDLKGKKIKELKVKDFD